jgi:pimeloyl-ACP methyl ester carboxylesterase
LVFVDQRGTGGSNLLYCELFDPKNIASYLTHWNPPAAVKACRADLEKKADLRLYTTSIAMDDLNDVRIALGYEKINLAGSSYGTRAVMAYVKQHESSVRSVQLHGVSPFDQFMPASFPQHTQRALDGVLDECLANADCAKAFPDIKKSERAVLAMLKKGPVDVDVEVDKKPLKVRLSRDLAAEAIRYMLYQSGNAGRIPMVLTEASKGNFKPLAEAAIFYRRLIVATGATGLYLSITCAEDLPFAKPTAANAEDTFLGSYRLREQREACAGWPRSEVRKDYATLVRSNIPALIYSGQWDPVTPPEYGDRVAKNLPNSLHLVVPSGGHGFGGLAGVECLEDITAKFFETGSTKGLAASACLGSIKRTGFRLK